VRLWLAGVEGRGRGGEGLERGLIGTNGADRARGHAATNKEVKRNQKETKKNERNESKAPGMHPSILPTPSHPIPSHPISRPRLQPTNQQQHIHPNLTHPLPPSFSYPQRATHQTPYALLPLFLLSFYFSLLLRSTTF